MTSRQNVRSHIALLASVSLLGLTACSAKDAAPSGDAVTNLSAAQDCTQESIQALAPKGTTITTSSPTAEPVPHCLVDGYVTTTDPGPNQVNFRLQLPDSNFNGRYIMAGMGGAAGYVPTNMQIPGGNPIVKGFAMAGTDTGHQGEILDWTFMADNPAKAIDYVHRGAHVVAQSTQAITRSYYDTENLHRYMSGCSGGGRMGVAVAEYHPEDFDGVLIGAPGRSSGTMLMFMWATQQMAREPGAWVSPAKRILLEQKVTAACDMTDGAMDGVVWRPDECDYDPAQLLCADTSSDTSACLTAPELKTVKAILDGPRYPDGTRITEGMPITNSGDGWTSFLGVAPPPLSKSISLKDIADTSAGAIIGHTVSKAYFGPDYDFTQDFDFNNPEDFTQWWAGANRLTFGKPHSADLRAAEEAGLKIIWWHGVSDAGPTLSTTFSYFDDALKSLDNDEARLAQTARLYQVPGMLHCGSGTGPDDVPDRLLDELMNWTEQGVAPGPVITGRGPTKANLIFQASAGDTTSGVRIPTSHGADREFLLCPEPLRSTFNGPVGGEDLAINWSCEKP